MSERGCQTYLDQKSFAQIATRIQNSQIRLQLQPGHQEEQPSTKGKNEIYSVCSFQN